SARIRLSVKINDEYKHCKELPPALLAQQGPVGPARRSEKRLAITAGREPWFTTSPFDNSNMELPQLRIALHR
ncbi:hypothetical protein SERLA73DRAFT_56935, partial [Serpula lacrymans var. lacrymans S7.3]